MNYLKKDFYLIKNFLKDLIKGKIFIFTFLSGILFGVISILLTEISYDAVDEVTTSFGLGFLSILCNFLAVFFGITQFGGDSAKSAIALLITKPVSVGQIIYTKVIAFALALAISLFYFSRTYWVVFILWS